MPRDDHVIDVLVAIHQAVAAEVVEDDGDREQHEYERRPLADQALSRAMARRRGDCWLATRFARKRLGRVVAGKKAIHVLEANENGAWTMRPDPLLTTEQIGVPGSAALQIARETGRLCMAGPGSFRCYGDVEDPAGFGTTHAVTLPVRASHRNSSAFTVEPCGHDSQALSRGATSTRHGTGALWQRAASDLSHRSR